MSSGLGDRGLGIGDFFENRFLSARVASVSKDGSQ